MKTPLEGSTGMTRLLREAKRRRNINQLNAQINRACHRLAMVRKRAEQLDQLRRARRRAACWWEAPVEELSVPQLHQLRAALNILRNKIQVKVALAAAEKNQNQGVESSAAAPAVLAGGNMVTNVNNPFGPPCYLNFSGLNFGPYGLNVAGGFSPVAVAGPSSNGGWVMEQELAGRFMAQYGADEFNLSMMMMNGTVTPAPAPVQVFPAGFNGGGPYHENFVQYQQNMVDGYINYHGGQEVVASQENGFGRVSGGHGGNIAGPGFSGDHNPHVHGFF